MPQPSAWLVQVYISPSRTDYVFVTGACAAKILKEDSAENRVQLLCSLGYKILAMYEAKTTERLRSEGESPVTSQSPFKTCT